MKGKRINIFCMAMAAAMLLAGCKNARENAAAPSGETTAADHSAAEPAAGTIVDTVADAIVDTAAESTVKKTGKAKKQPTPLTAGKNKAYYENEDFSVTAELTDLCSSLYYPDIVHDMGANPDLFTVTVKVNAKNMTEEEKTFDASKFSLPEMFYTGGDTEKFENIKPSKTVSGELRFLCSLEQAEQISGIFYGNEYLETGEEFYPEKFDGIIEKQSADDVRDYLYRTWEIWGRQQGYHTLRSSPTAYQAHHIKAISSGDKNYLSITYSAYNRSDYAQLIEPAAFEMMCYKKGQKFGDNVGAEFVYPLYISTDPELIYEPVEAELKLKGVGQLYELPEFICMNQDNPTIFTIVYDFRDLATVSCPWFNSSHDEPYYSDLDGIGYGLFNWDAWDEKYIDD